jgi:hypothetical protein
MVPANMPTCQFSQFFAAFDRAENRFHGTSSACPVCTAGYALTFDPMIRFPLGHRLGAYAIGGIGWYHRSGETTRPGAAVICDPYWSWWYGCTIGSVNIVTGSTSADAFGENIGGGVTYRLGEGGLKFYTEFRYHHASYHKVSTNIIALTFGIRW